MLLLYYLEKEIKCFLSQNFEKMPQKKITNLKDKNYK